MFVLMLRLWKGREGKTAWVDGIYARWVRLWVAVGG